MKKLFLLNIITLRVTTIGVAFYLLHITPLSYAQQSKPKTYNDSQNMKVVVEQDAQYPGGDNALLKYIRENIKYPEQSKGKVIDGEIMLSINVEPDSSLSGIVLIKGVGNGVDEEVISLIKPLKFAPSIQNGTKVKMNVIQSIPIRFRND